MIQLTKRLAMTADKHCYIVGQPRQRADKGVVLSDPKYYTTADQAVRGALDTAMRMAVERNEVTTLRQFIEEQERLRSELDKLVAPLAGEEAHT